MPEPLDLARQPPGTAGDAGFDAKAFDAGVELERQRAAAGAYAASCEGLEAWLRSCPSTEMRRRATVLTLLAHHYPRMGHLTAGVRCASEAQGLAERLSDDRLLADALTSQCFVHAQLLLGREALALGMRAVAAARRAGDATREAWALNRLAVAYANLENPQQACICTEQALKIATHAAAAEARFASQNNLAYYWLKRLDDARADGDAAGITEALAQARTAAEQASALARSSRSPFQIAVAVSNLVNALLAGGALQEALPLLDEFGHLVHDNGYDALAAEADVQRAIFLHLNGDSHRAVRMLEALLHTPTELLPPLRRLMIRSLHEIHKACGQHREALVRLEELVALDRRNQRDNLRLQTEVLLIRDEVEQAQARADSAADDARRAREHAAYLESEQQRLREYAMALDRAAHEDVLTGLHNRRHAEYALPLLIEGARVAGQVISVAALDVDHFKSINDNHGHAVGDAVLQQLARLLQQRLRSADLVARIGGEEFIAVLVGTAPRQAVEVCERLRQAVAGHDWSAITPGLAVRISVGIAGGLPPQSLDLLQQADEALYAAKRGGRNRVHLPSALE